MKTTISSTLAMLTLTFVPALANAQGLAGEMTFIYWDVMSENEQYSFQLDQRQLADDYHFEQQWANYYYQRYLETGQSYYYNDYANSQKNADHYAQLYNQRDAAVRTAIVVKLIHDPHGQIQGTPRLGAFESVGDFLARNRDYFGVTRNITITYGDSGSRGVVASGGGSGGGTSGGNGNGNSSSGGGSAGGGVGSVASDDLTLFGQ